MGVFYGVTLALAANLVTAIALVIQKTIVSEERASVCPSGHDSILSGTINRPPLGWGLCIIAYLMLGLGYFIDILCLEYLSLSSVGALSASQLIFSTMIGCFFMGEALSIWGGAGVICIICGCVAMVMASPSAKRGSNDEGAIILWLVFTTVITMGLVAIATLRERIWQSSKVLNSISDVSRFTLSLLPWVFAAAGGLSASDTLLLSKALVNEKLIEWQIILTGAIILEIFIQLYLIKAAFATAAAFDFTISDPCVLISSTFAVSTILIATVCAGVVYGEFNEYAPIHWVIICSGLISTTIGLCLLSWSREKS